jgi:tripartite-type tricarboxylate transporter receptor subunit TctC
MKGGICFYMFCLDVSVSWILNILGGVEMKGSKKFTLAACVLIGLTAALAGPVAAKDDAFPKKEITMVIPWAAGGSTDIAGRKIQQILREEFSINTIIKNVPGGASIVGLSEVKTAKADGYTVGLGSGSFLSIGAVGQTTLKIEDFSNISLLSEDPLMLVVKTDAPWKNLQEYVEYMKSSQNPSTIGIAGTNTINQLVAMELVKIAKTQYQHIPFDGAAQAITSIMGGHVDAGVVKPSEAMSQFKEKQIRILAIANDKRFDSLPDVPTFKESGYDVTGTQITFIVAPKNIDPAVRTSLIELFDKAVQSDTYQKFSFQQGFISQKKSGADLDKHVVDLYKDLRDAFGSAAKK